MLSLTRILLVVLLLISIVQWISISSIVSSAIHIFAKSNFSVEIFGSVSRWFINVSFAWLFFMSFLIFWKGNFSKKRFVPGLFFILVWESVVAISMALGANVLSYLGGWGVLVWALELIVAAYFVHVTLFFIEDKFKNYGLILLLSTLTLTMAAKLLFLCLSPGVVIRMQ